MGAGGFEVDLAVGMNAESGVRQIYPYGVNVPAFVEEEFGAMGKRQSQRSTDDLPTRKHIEALELGLGMEAVWGAENVEEENKQQGVCFGGRGFERQGAGEYHGSNLRSVGHLCVVMQRCGGGRAPL